LTDSVTRSVDQAVHDCPGTLQITQRPQHLVRQACRLANPEVGPGSRDQ
jgi:hypothetical protein